MTLLEALQLAVAHHQSGRLAEAEGIYRQILAVEPRQAESLHYLGVIAHQVGRSEVAVDLIRQSIAVTPGVSNAHSNLGEAYRALGQVDEAIAAYRQAIVLDPGSPESYSNLGIVLALRGRLDEAMAVCRQAIALRPGFSEAHINLGNILKEKGRLDEAVTALRQAVALAPHSPQAHFNLGVALQAAGQAEEAVPAYRQSIALRPNDPDACCNLGIVLCTLRRLDESIAAHRQAIALKPAYAEAHSNLGNALQDKGQLDEAITAHRRAIALDPTIGESHNNLGIALTISGRSSEAMAAFRQAIVLKPNYPPAHNNLGNALLGEGQLDEAIAAYREGVALDPDYPAVHNNLGTALKDSGRLDEAIASYREAMRVRPNYAAAHSNLILALNYHPGVDDRVIADEQRRWNQQHAAPLRHLIQPHGSERAPGRRLRIGYVSPDFRRHSVASFFESLLAGHDPAAVETFLYSDVIQPDAVTARLRARAAHWREIQGMADAEVAQLIAEDRIDILVDLAGHTAHNRLLVFARQSAPVQVTYLGYPGSTGLEAMDYRLTDALADPPGGTQELQSEALIRLPQCAWCFRPADEAPAVASLPMRRAGHITFGSFNAWPKMNAAFLKSWSEILLAVPGSRLLVKNRALRNASTQEGLRTVLGGFGIGPERIEWEAYAATPEEHLALYGRVDIALDTFPYHGTTTTCEALWMGVPVVTLAGERHASRVGVSLLTNVGLPELVARSAEEYVRIAVGLTGDLARLEEMRGTLRERMAASPLMDGVRLARAVEGAYREMSRRAEGRMK